MNKLRFDVYDITKGFNKAFYADTFEKKEEAIDLIKTQPNGKEFMIVEVFFGEKKRLS